MRVRKLAAPALVLTAASVVTLTASPAQADKNDLVLARLADNTTSPGRVIPDSASFRSLVSELGVAMAPRTSTPADTIGWSGLELATDYAFSTINNADAYWCATEESTGCTEKGSSSLGTFGVFVRKGIALPLPSLEISAGATHLTGSRLWTVQMGARLAILEGFHGWSIPSVAMRFGAGRLMGTTELDLTTISTDLTISKTFAIADTVRLSPWAGWNVLWIIPRSGVIDKTPEIDASVMPDDLTQNFTFPDQDTIVRQRLFIGAKLRYGVLAFSFEASFAFAGFTSDSGYSMSCSDAPAAMKGSCNADDNSGSQQTYTISLAADF